MFYFSGLGSFVWLKTTNTNTTTQTTTLTHNEIDYVNLLLLLVVRFVYCLYPEA